MLFVTIGNMPITKTKNKIQKPRTTRVKPAVAEEYSSYVNSSSTNPLVQLKRLKDNKFVYLAIVIIVLALLISYKKSWFIAATVNGAPISNFELLSREDSQFRKQMLDQMINEKLILSEAGKKGIKVSEQDIDAKIADIEKQVGGANAFDSLLAQQGETRTGVRNQIRITLSLEKMYTNEALVSAEEVTKFIEQNKDQMQSSQPAELTKEATDILKSQKLNQIYNQKFQEIKKAANIQIF